MSVPPGRGSSAARPPRAPGRLRAPDAPNLTTNVATTDATLTGNQMTAVIDDDLAAKNLAPGRHYEDSGYLSAALVVSEAARDLNRRFGNLYLNVT
jgi:hypothetical protein